MNTQLVYFIHERLVILENLIANHELNVAVVHLREETYATVKKLPCYMLVKCSYITVQYYSRRASRHSNRNIKAIIL